MVTSAVLFIALMFGSSPLHTSRLQLSYFSGKKCYYKAMMQICTGDRRAGQSALLSLDQMCI